MRKKVKRGYKGCGINDIRPSKLCPPPMPAPAPAQNKRKKYDVNLRIEIKEEGNER